MSLINREALIAEYDRVHVGAPGGARKLMVDAPEVKPEPKWIPCSERLLEAEVLCCDIRGGMIIGYPYQDDESETGYSAVSDDVYMIDCIAWMPLPAPYKKEIQ